MSAILMRVWLALFKWKTEMIYWPSCKHSFFRNCNCWKNIPILERFWKENRKSIFNSFCPWRQKNWALNNKEICVQMRRGRLFFFSLWWLENGHFENIYKRQLLLLLLLSPLPTLPPLLFWGKGQVEGSSTDEKQIRKQTSMEANVRTRSQYSFQRIKCHLMLWTDHRVL